MNLRFWGVLIVGLHGGAAIWHLVVTARAVPSAGVMSLTLPITLIALVHAAVMFIAWLTAPRIVAWILSAFFIAMLIFDLYEHFLGAVPTNIFHVAPGEWVGLFRVSVFALLALELVGIAVASRWLTSPHAAES
ncbi:MAG TPA: hypothetical protein VN745_09770 [Verrucomicrobiae bacterium]|nr:hypothetical protein [Verrucomicrobiae bacterium]